MEDKKRKEKKCQEAPTTGVICSSSSSSSSSGSSGFWNILEEEKGIEIPIYLKNILSLNNLDNPISFQCINEETISELEEFARNSMLDFLTESEKLEHYYGRYHGMPEKFRFLIGDRFLIRKLASFVKAKPEDFWKTSRPVARSDSPEEQEPVVEEPLSRIEREQKPSVAPRSKKRSSQPQPQPPEHDSEIGDLERLVGSAIRRDLGPHYPNVSEMLDKIHVQLNTQALYDKSNNVFYVSTALIRCVLCPSSISIRKHSFPGATKCRWIISNYRRHLKTHARPRLVQLDAKPLQRASFVGEENDLSNLENGDYEAHVHEEDW